MASFFGREQVVKMLIAHSNKMTEKGYEHGILDVNKTDTAGFTPLFVAAQNGHMNIIRFLLENQADVNARAHRTGNDALAIAEMRGHTQVVDLLTDVKYGQSANNGQSGGNVDRNDAIALIDELLDIFAG